MRSDALFNREKILAAAAETLAARGQNVPLAEIAGAAGVGVGTLYRGFPDRTALMHALEHRAYELLNGVLIGSPKAAAPARTRSRRSCWRTSNWANNSSFRCAARHR